MIENITIKNFKSWRDLNVNFGKLTGLFGTNSSGKTSIIQSLLLLKQTVESADRAQVLHFGDNSTYVGLGTFSDVIHKHNQNLPLQFDITVSLRKKLEVLDPELKNSILFKDNLLRFSTEIKESDTGRMFVEEMGYYFGVGEFFMSRTNKRDRYEYKLQNKKKENIYNTFKFKRTQGRQWGLPSPIKFYGFPDQVNAYYQNTSFLADLQLHLENSLKSIYYLGPLRDYPKREYSWGGGNPSDMGRRGEQVVDAMLASKIRDKRIARGRGKPKFTVEEYVAFWLKELGLIQSFRVQEIADGSNLYRVYVKRNKSSSEVLISDVGFGVSQILPVITLCYYAPEGSTLIIEQPEIHLHPSVQAGLADVFMDAIKVRNLQIIVESHSEYLIKRLQRRVAESEFEHDDATLYFCSNRGDSSKIERLKMDMFGSIENWPSNFFGDEFGEVAKTAKAALQKKKKMIGNGVRD